MREAVFRFHDELNDFLSTERRDTEFSHSFLLPASIKDVIEAFGVPHPEVELILVNSVPVDFSYLVQDADRVSVYPASASLPVTSVVQLRPQLQVFGFVLDTHLGRVATYLRMLGFDVVYQNRCDGQELAHISAAEYRILLTRDRGLLKRGAVIWGHFVRATEPRAQLLEVLRRFNLFHLAERFRRCVRCNSLYSKLRKSRSMTGCHHERLSVMTIFVSAPAAIASTGPAPTTSTCSDSSSASSALIEVAEFSPLTIPE